MIRKFFLVSCVLIIGSYLSSFAVNRSEAASNATIRYGIYTIEAFTTTGTTTWVAPANVSKIDVLVVAAGGAGGTSNQYPQGGGGAGGLSYQSLRSVTPGNSYTVTVGSGISNSNGGNSVFDTITSFGGGRGGSGYQGSGSSGGSGGGAGRGGVYGAATQTSNGGATGYGNAGGSNSSGTAGAGGGGAGSAGLPRLSSVNNGGSGKDYSSVFGTGYGESGWFSGGGGTGFISSYGVGGMGGGGDPKQVGSPNTGGGAGGGAGNDQSFNVKGGSGIVLLKYIVRTPSVTTQSCTNVSSDGTNYAAIANGMRVLDYGGKATTRGFVYMPGTTGDPTIANSIVSESGIFYEDSGSYSIPISGLSAITKYYRVRAFQTNQYGTGYGETVQLTLQYVPSIITQSASMITSNSFVMSGEITSLGDQSPTIRGFCYMIGTTGTPTMDNLTVYDSGTYSVGVYTKTISGLSSFTSYRVRSYSVSSAGTGYGATVTVSTTSLIPTLTTESASSISFTSFTGNGDIINVGSESVTRRGFCYMTGVSGDPTISNSVAYEDGTFSTGAYSKSVTNLADGTSYRVRAYASNSGGVGYGVTVTISTLSTSDPTLSTQSSLDVAVTSFTADGTISSLDQNASRRGFCYVLSSLSRDPVITDGVVYENGSYGTSSYRLSVTGLSNNASYRVRSYATVVYSDSLSRTGYGSSVTVTTLSGIPDAETLLPTNIASTSFVARGQITSVNGMNATRRGFCYSKTSFPPTLSDSVVSEDGNFGVGEFSLTIINLTPNALYSVRAFATSSYGTNYGVATSTGIPTVTTQSCTDTAVSSTIAHGTITDLKGATNITRRGFCYMIGSSGTPTISNSTVFEDGSFDVGSYSRLINGLSGSTSYRVRSYAVTNYGVGYGTIVTVSTLIGLPSVSTQTCTEITSTSAMANGNVVNLYSGGNVSRRGFCYFLGVSGTPTVSDNVVYEDGSFGVGAYSLLVDNLTLSDNYRVRAYAVNSYGISYGSTVSVKAPIIAPPAESPPPVATPTMIIVYVTVPDVPVNQNITEMGVFVDVPYIPGPVGSSGTPAHRITVYYPHTVVPGSAPVDIQIPNLPPDVEYTITPFAVTVYGVGYGESLTVRTLEDKSTEGTSVVTQSCTDVQATSFIAHGNITESSDGVTRRGFCYVSLDISRDPTISDNVVYEDGTFGAGEYSMEITGIVENTNYKVKSYVVTPNDMVYGNTMYLIPIARNFLDVTITAIPSYVAMTNSESSWSLGIVRKNSVYYWTVNEAIPLEPFAEEDMKSLITNTGTVSEIIMISATNFVGGTGWILSEVTGSNLVIMSSGVTGDNLTSMRILSDNVSRELYHDIPSKSSFRWCMILSTGTFTDNVEKSSVVTVTAVAH